MTTQKCIICLEELPSHRIRKICRTCNESYICNECIQSSLENGHEDLLSNCPICNTPTDFHHIPSLSLGFQLLTVAVWWLRGFSLIPWKVIPLLHTLYTIFSNLCIRQDRTTDNSPRTLRLKWKILMTMIHTPYIFYLLVFPKASDGEDGYLSEYFLFHVFVPTITGFLIWAYRKFARVG